MVALPTDQVQLEGAVAAYLHLAPRTWHLVRQVFDHDRRTRLRIPRSPLEEETSLGGDFVVSACDRRLGELTGVEQRTYTVDANRGGRREFCFESSKGFTALRRLRVGLQRDSVLTAPV